MIKKQYTIMLLWILLGCQSQVDNQEIKQKQMPKAMHKIDERDSLQLVDNELAVIDKLAKNRKSAEYGGGDVYGVKTYCYNDDSTLLKVVNVSSAGDYGFAKEQYYLKEGKLLYSEKLTAEIDFEQESNKGTYNISYQKIYFTAIDKGLRLVRQKVAQQRYDTLFDRVAMNRSPLTGVEYEKELSLLKEIEGYELLDEN